MNRIAYGVLELFPNSNDLQLETVNYLRVLDDEMMIRF